MTQKMKAKIPNKPQNPSKNRSLAGRCSLTCIWWSFELTFFQPKCVEFKPKMARFLLSLFWCGDKFKGGGRIKGSKVTKGKWWWQGKGEESRLFLRHSALIFIALKGYLSAVTILQCTVELNQRKLPWAQKAHRCGFAESCRCVKISKWLRYSVNNLRTIHSKPWNFS